MTIPSEDRYRQLLAALRDATKHIEAADTDDQDGRRERLTAGYTALQEVIIYLSGDPEVRTGGLTRPLGLIENALRDAGRGAAPPMLDLNPEGPGTKPRGTTREDVQGGVAAAVEVLAAGGGWNTGPATDWVVAEARRKQLSCVDGSPITLRQASTWRSEIKKRKAPAEAQRAFDELCEYERAKAWWNLPRSHPAKRTEAKTAAAQIIAFLANIVPRTAPRLTSRSADFAV